jgi:hypothetical protein
MGNSETVFLQLATGEGGRYKMLSVMIPVASAAAQLRVVAAR